MDASEFVARWRKLSLQNEMQVYHDHLDDLCRLANHPTRTDYDKTGQVFAVQKAVTKLGGTTGAADAWFKGHFAIEYKGKGANLDNAYAQLLLYRDNLENPPLLIVSDLDRIIIRTNYTNRVTRVIELNLDSFASGEKVGDTGCNAVEIIWKCFWKPEDLVPPETPAKLTETVAEKFKFVADSLKKARSAKYDEKLRDYPRLYEDMDIAKFLNRMVFCMFASDAGLLPPNLISTIIDNSRTTARATAEQFAELFAAMATGGHFGPYYIPHFNGGLFKDADVIEVDSFSLAELHMADRENWADVEPSIFGTLFERIIDEKQRKALGKHYTSREDIELLIHPVIMWPLLREWGGEDAIDQPLSAPPTGGLRREIEDRLSRNKYNEAEKLACHAKLQAFIDRLGHATALDPACGSGNFLYVALEKLVALEHEAVKLALAWELPPLQRKVHPRQLFGIEKNEYAHQLASTVVWIGYLQSKRKRGDYTVDDPVLEPLDNIQNKDAILDLTDPDDPKDPEWPEAEFIVGNPPFLGGKLLRRELGNRYVDDLFATYDHRVRRESDICCYWFEKARAAIQAEGVQRAGLLATQGIRGGANRAVLERIKSSGDIFFAVDDRAWVLDGAAVQVSMVGFDDGSEARRVVLKHRETLEIDGNAKPRKHKKSFETVQTEGISAQLEVIARTPGVLALSENKHLSFMGVTRVGPFELSSQVAARFLVASNPHGRPNSEVVRPWLNARDIAARSRNNWIVDFPPGTTEVEAAKYQEPFNHIRTGVGKFRATALTGAHGDWWVHHRSRPAMRSALRGLARYLATPMVAKHRMFVWVDQNTLCENVIIVFARDDDYFFGVLHSRVHEAWALHMGTQLESRPRYTPTTCFETFPLPWPPGSEPVDDPNYKAIAEAARELNEQRERALNPDPLPEPEELKKLTLTNLYNRMKAGELTWLANAHEKLDRAVFAAYGWPYPLDDQEILSRLLAENLRRSQP